MDDDINESLRLRMSLRERPRKVHAERKLKQQSDELLYEPDSSRDKRKLPKKKSQQLRSVYDEYGHIRYNGMDVCDCMDDDCPGCWYECENCGSNKCGIQCRVNRKFFYESITFDGKDATIKNKYAPLK